MFSKKSKLFANYSEFSLFLSAHLKSINPSFKPIDMKRTINIQFNNLRRLPTYVKEPFFMDMFNTHTVFPEIKDMKGEAQKLRTEAVDKLISMVKPKIKDSVVRNVLTHMSCALKLQNVSFTVQDFYSVFDYLPGKTSSGFPDHVTPKREHISVITRQFQALKNGEDLDFLDYPVYVSWRTQMRPGPKFKFRQFFPMPMLIQSLEGMFAIPFFKHFEINKLTPYCYGNVFTDLLPRINHWNTRKQIISIDFKGFDLSISNLLIEIAFKFLKRHLRLNNSFLNLIYNKIVKYHTNCYVITAFNGKPAIFSKMSGLMSGSVFTNLLGSLINLFCILYYCVDKKIPFVYEDFSILGDDIIFSTDADVSLEEMSVYFKETFGLTISIDKSDVFKPFEKIFFLGHKIDMNGRYLDWELAKAQLSYSETYIPEDKMSTEYRLISKFCSICYKCTDGCEFFRTYAPELKNKLNLNSLPEYFQVMFWTQDNKEVLKIEEIFQNGWMKC